MPDDRPPVRSRKLTDVDDLAARIPNGASLAVPSNLTGVSMAATRALLRRGARDLHLMAIPTSGLQADLLIGAGAVAEIDFSAVSLGEFGLAPRFTDAVRGGAVVFRDATCPAMHAAIAAGARGIPFMPLRGVLGSDLVRHRPDWSVIQNPLAPEEDPILLIPAIQPDVALFHAPLADTAGNVWVGTRRELMTMAQAAARTFVTVEEIVDGDLLHDPAMAPGTLQKMYVTAVAPAPRGAWPLALPTRYGVDSNELRRYAEAAKTPAGFDAYVERICAPGFTPPDGPDCDR